MTNAYWYGPKSDLDLEAGNTAGGFDSLGLHNCCRQFKQGSFGREAPVESLGLGAVTQVAIKCDVGINITDYYPNFLNKSKDDMKVYIDTEANHFFDPAGEQE